MKRLRSPILASVWILTPIMVLAAATVARADIPPSCDSQSSLITCAAADVGKPCQGAGQCYAVSCSPTTPPTTQSTVYKCDVCPTVLTTSSVTCSTTNVGADCGNGGKCTVLSSWCIGTSSKYSCAVPAAAQPTGPPTGETGAGGASSTGAAGGGGTNSTGAAGAGGANNTGAAGASTTGAAGGGGTIPIEGDKTDSGCTVGAGTQTTAGIAGGLIVIGLGFLSLSRRRRPR